jgi:hypothetical protein
MAQVKKYQKRHNRCKLVSPVLRAEKTGISARFWSNRNQPMLPKVYACFKPETLALNVLLEGTYGTPERFDYEE